MPESSSSRLVRWKFNLFPAYRGTGARVTYSAVDPMFMIMLIRILGRDFIVWDKVATIRFRKPGRTTLYATFLIDEAEIEAIRAATADGRSADRTYHVDLVDEAGVVH